MYHVGFVSLSILIFLTPIYLSYLLKFKSTTPSPFVRYLLFLFCFHFTLISSYLKLLFSSSTLWLLSITPPCVLVLLEIVVTIKHECDRVTSRDNFMVKLGLGVLASLLFTVVFLPPFFSLYLYCFYLDYHFIFQRYPFDFSQCLIPLTLHLLFGFAYILKYLMELSGIRISHHQLIEMILSAEEMMLTE
jgi:hypothetical protein